MAKLLDTKSLGEAGSSSIPGIPVQLTSWLSFLVHEYMVLALRLNP